MSFHVGDPKGKSIPTVIPVALEPFPFRLNRNGGSISLFDAFFLTRTGTPLRWKTALRLPHIENEARLVAHPVPATMPAPKPG